MTIEIESETEAARVAEIGERLGIRPRVAVRVNPDFEVKGSGMRMGGGPQQFGVDAEQRARRCSRDLARGRPRAPRLPRLRRLAEPQRRDPLRGAAQRPSSSRCGWPTRRRRRSATSTSAAASASPTSSSDEPLDLAADRRQPRRAARRRDPPEPPRRARRDRARPLHRRRGGRLRHPGRRPQGVARQDLPGRRRRHAPPARRLGQLRPGDPPQLPGRDRQPRRRRRRPRRSASSAACARRSTCSPTTSRCRAPTSATWSSSSRPAPTGSPRARPRSSAIRRPSRCWSSDDRPGRPRGLRSGFRASPRPLHLGLLARRPRCSTASRRRADRATRLRFLVLVPAHNEEPVIGRCLEAIHADRGPGRPGAGRRRSLHRRDRGDRSPVRRVGARARARARSPAAPPRARPASTTRGRSSGTPC